MAESLEYAVDGWVILPPGGNVDDFLEKHKPSKSSSSSVQWISVRNESEGEKEEQDIPKAITLWEELTAGTTKVTAEDVKDIAVSTGVTSGKWLIYRKSHEIDGTWDKVARATVKGELGTSAKVSTPNPKSLHVMCVYTNDFTNEEDAMKVEAGLRKLGVTGTLLYKPDIYTYLDIYAKNKWKIKATVFTTKS